MKLKYEFYFHPVGENHVGVAVSDNAKEFNGMLQLDEVSYDIVSHIKDDITRDQLIDQMLTIYDDDRSLVAQYVDKVLNYLTEQGVLSL